MSIKMITYAFKSFEDSKLSPAQKLVLLALADHANDEDQLCWPSLNHLSKKTGMDRGTIWRSIQKLETLGLIKIVKKGTNGPIPESTLYYIALGDSSLQLGESCNRPVRRKQQALGESCIPNHNINRNESIFHASHKPWKPNK